MTITVARVAAVEPIGDSIEPREMTFGVTPIEEQSVWGLLFCFFLFFTPHPVQPLNTVLTRVFITSKGTRHPKGRFMCL